MSSAILIAWISVGGKHQYFQYVVSCQINNQKLAILDIILVGYAEDMKRRCTDSKTERERLKSTIETDQGSRGMKTQL